MVEIMIKFENTPNLSIFKTWSWV